MSALPSSSYPVSSQGNDIPMHENTFFFTSSMSLKYSFETGFLCMKQKKSACVRWRKPQDGWSPNRDSPGSALLSWQNKRGQCHAKGTSCLVPEIAASFSKSEAPSLQLHRGTDANHENHQSGCPVLADILPGRLSHALLYRYATPDCSTTRCFPAHRFL